MSFITDKKLVLTSLLTKKTYRNKCFMIFDYLHPVIFFVQVFANVGLQKAKQGGVLLKVNMILSKVFVVSFSVKFSPLRHFFTSLRSFIRFISTTAKSISKYFYPKLDARCSLTGQRKNFSTSLITKTKVKQKEIRKEILKYCFFF